MDFFDIFSSVLTEPTKFFTKIKKEATIKKSLIYLLIFLIITNIITILPSIIDPLGFVLAIIGAVFGIAVTVGFYFLGIAIIHLFVMLMGGK